MKNPTYIIHEQTACSDCCGKRQRLIEPFRAMHRAAVALVNHLSAADPVVNWIDGDLKRLNGIVDELHRNPPWPNRIVEDCPQCEGKGVVFHPRPLDAYLFNSLQSRFV